MLLVYTFRATPKKAQIYDCHYDASVLCSMFYSYVLSISPYCSSFSFFMDNLSKSHVIYLLSRSHFILDYPSTPRLSGINQQHGMAASVLYMWPWV